MNANHLLLLLVASLGPPLGAQTFAPLVGGHLCISDGGPQPAQLEDLLAADLDGDGALDVIGAGVWRNDRTGGLVPWQTWVGGRRNALADVDGDGDLDLLTGSGSTRPNGSSPGPVGQWENRGGTFVVAIQRMPLGAWVCGAIVAFDHDRDGDVDLVMTTLEHPTTDFVVMDNNGHGNFALSTASRMPAGLPRVRAEFLAASDLDRDGDLDLVVSEPGRTLFLFNDGTGQFTNRTASLPGVGSVYLVMDFDRDGDDDLFGTNAIWMNDGSATTLTPRATGMQLGTANVRVADLDGDGRLDLVTTRVGANNAIPENDGVPHVWLGQADGTFVERPSFIPAELRAERAATSGNQHWIGASPILIADFDRDGRPDLVHGGWKGHTSGNSWTIGLPPRLLLNRDGVEFRDGSRRSIPMLDMDTVGLFAGDLDRDGHTDLILGQYAGDRVLRGRGDGSFDLAETLPGSSASRSGLLVDLDNDGDLDFVRSGFHADYWPGAPPSLLLRQGSAWVPAPLPPIIDPGVTFAAGDVDRDGDVDLVVGCVLGWPNGARNQLLLNDGTARFTDGGSGRLPQEQQDTARIFLRDVDADGDLDLVEFARNYPANRLRLSLNDGTGTFTDVSAARLPAIPAPYDLAAVDIDRDGDIDLVTSAATLVNDGTGRFTAQAPGFGQFDHLVDLDGSGAWTTVRAERDAVVIGEQSHGWNRDSINVTVPADVDHDGDVDVVVAAWVMGRYNFNAVAGVLFNLGRQLHAPRLLRLGQPWVLSLQANRAGALGIPILGTSALAPRLSIAPFGQLGVDPTTAVVLPAVAVGTSPAPNELRLPVPTDASLVGVPLHAQALIVPTSGLQDARLTGVVSDRITR